MIFSTGILHINWNFKNNILLLGRLFGKNIYAYHRNFSIASVQLSSVFLAIAAILSLLASITFSSSSHTCIL